MPKITRSQATEQERGNYLEAGLETQTALHTAIRLLKAKEVLCNDPDESRIITVEVLNLESAVARIQADLIAFLSEQRAIQPPTSGDVSAFKQVARQLDQMTSNSMLVNTVLAAATNVLQLWRATV